MKRTKSSLSQNFHMNRFPFNKSIFQKLYQLIKDFAVYEKKRHKRILYLKKNYVDVEF